MGPLPEKKNALILTGNWNGPESKRDSWITIHNDFFHFNFYFSVFKQKFKNLYLKKFCDAHANRIIYIHTRLQNYDSAMAKKG